MEDQNILVISDTHGNSRLISTLLTNYLKVVTTVVHLGDHARDMVRFVRDKHVDDDLNKIEFHVVNGNTDPLIDIYEERVIEVAGKSIFITHGHNYDVKSNLDRLIERAQELHVDACLFGHTHIPTLFTQNGILFLNPGSATYPHPDTEKGYGLLRISEGPDGTGPVITGKLLPYKDPVGWEF